MALLTRTPTGVIKLVNIHSAQFKVVESDSFEYPVGSDWYRSSFEDMLGSGYKVELLPTEEV